MVEDGAVHPLAFVVRIHCGVHTISGEAVPPSHSNPANHPQDRPDDPSVDLADPLVPRGDRITPQLPAEMFEGRSRYLELRPSLEGLEQELDDPWLVCLARVTDRNQRIRFTRRGFGEARGYRGRREAEGGRAETRKLPRRVPSDRPARHTSQTRAEQIHRLSRDSGRPAVVLHEIVEATPKEEVRDVMTYQRSSRSARTRRDQVMANRLAHRPELPAGLERADTQVGLLEVHEVARIEPIQLAQELRSDQLHGAAEPVGAKGSASRLERLLCLDRQSQRPADDSPGSHQSTRTVRLAGTAQQRRSHDPGPRVLLHEVDQNTQGSRVEYRIRVQEQNVRRHCRRPPQIAARAVADVLLALDQLQPIRFPTQDLDGPVRAGVVDHDTPEKALLAGLTQRLERLLDRPR